MTGCIHSYETCGAVDGPGIRFVVFTQGCPLRCKYCHNPDTWAPGDGETADIDALINKIERYKPFMRSTGGGLTVSGGEPLMQADFVSSLFEKARTRDIHTALDTSGAGSAKQLDQVLNFTDLMLLDVKSTDEDTYHKLTGGRIESFFRALQTAEEKGVDVWLRLVVVPGYTDRMIEIENINALTKTYRCIKKVELLPFHKMGEYKWAELNLEYELGDTPEPDAGVLSKMEAALRQPGES